jgi:phytol kinase
VTPLATTTPAVLLAVATIAALQTALVVAAGRLRVRGRLGPESSRKLAHVGSGVLALPLPWIFDRPLPVLVLCGLGLAAMIALRASPRSVAAGRALHDVERPSFGDLLFPISVACLFALAHTAPVLYVLPLLALAFADAAAALVGRRWPIGPYATAESKKSQSGSLAFAGATFLLVFASLLLFDAADVLRASLIALCAAVLLAIVEAISFRGLDNLLVPLIGHAVLAAQLALDAPSLALRTLVAVVLLLVLLRLRPTEAMLPDAVAALALFLYAIWATVGPTWLIPALASTALVLAAFRVSRSLSVDAGVAPRGAPVVVAMTLAALVWAVLAVTAPSDTRNDPGAFLAALAMSCTMLAHTALGRRSVALAIGVLALIVGWCTPIGPYVGPIAAVASIGLVVLAALRPIVRLDERLRWALRSLLLLVGSAMIAFAA